MAADSLASGIDGPKASSEFGRSVHQKNSKATLDQERKMVDELLDQKVAEVRALMTRRVELDVGARIMYGVDVGVAG